MSSRIDELRAKFKNSKSFDYMSWDIWFKQEVPSMQIRDFLRIESALMHSFDLFSQLDSIEDDVVFENLIGSTHTKADSLISEISDIDKQLEKQVGKDLIDEYL
jgi:hypothetical protein